MKYKNKEINCAIFDLDGTLLDSMGAWRKIDVEFFKKHKMEVPKDYHNAIAHMSLMMCAEYTKEAYGFKESVEEIIDGWNELASKIYLEEVKLKKGAIPLLDYLKKNDVLLMVATANDEHLYLPCLKRLNILDYFVFINDVEKSGLGKDSPKIFLDCANLAKQDPSNCIVFEDTLTALKICKENGFITCAMKENTVDEKQKVDEFDFYLTTLDEFII